MLLGCRAGQRSDSETKTHKNEMAVHYMEIVSSDADTLIGLYEHMHALAFSAPDADLGTARVATLPDGALIGIRKPLAEHEKPIVRTYLAVENIEQAVNKAAERGATIAYSPTRQGQRGTFAIVIQGGVELGLWQR